MKSRRYIYFSVERNDWIWPVLVKYSSNSTHYKCASMTQTTCILQDYLSQQVDTNAKHFNVSYKLLRTLEVYARIYTLRLLRIGLRKLTTMLCEGGSMNASLKSTYPVCYTCGRWLFNVHFWQGSLNEKNVMFEKISIISFKDILNNYN